MHDFGSFLPFRIKQIDTVNGWNGKMVKKLKNILFEAVELKFYAIFFIGSRNNMKGCINKFVKGI